MLKSLIPAFHFLLNVCVHFIYFLSSCREKTINFLPLLECCCRGGAYESGSAVGQQVECLCDFLLHGQSSDSETFLQLFCTYIKQRIHRGSKSQPDYECEEWPLFLTKPAVNTLHFYCPNAHVCHNIINAVSHLIYCRNTGTMAESEGKDIVICGDSFVKRLKYYCQVSTYLHLNIWNKFQLSCVHITM